MLTFSLFCKKEKIVKLYGGKIVIFATKFNNFTIIEFYHHIIK